MLCPFMTKTVEAVLPFYMVAFHHISKKKVLGRKSHVMPFLKLTILNHDPPLFCGRTIDKHMYLGTVSKVNDFLCFIMVSLRGFSFIDEQGATFNGWANLQQRPRPLFFLSSLSISDTVSCSFLVDKKWKRKRGYLIGAESNEKNESRKMRDEIQLILFCKFSSMKPNGFRLCTDEIFSVVDHQFQHPYGGVAHGRGCSWIAGLGEETFLLGLLGNHLTKCRLLTRFFPFETCGLSFASSSSLRPRVFQAL
ncbi:hypothetical protein BDA99DRAFT_537772 [Phascolomyces articulosus]|uniref:Uncharacterized protein n=1 Tax=Phascolomyces articulosus TaxID=60185 RepID=A0AAD5PFI7_9FUNG|nr:hypothetical protein BDA99DRAFT_537772 [Phascolomyces articulosus]